MDMVRYCWRKSKSAFKDVMNRRQFRLEFDQFAKLNNGQPRLPLRWEDTLPLMNERTGTLPFDASYVYHNAWAARYLARTRPERHVDISSYIFFVSIVSAFLPVDFYDYRPAPVRLSNLTSGSQDLLKLTFADKSIPSLSCMHVVEHIGLGRYGDPLDADGDLKAAQELKRVLAPGGLLLFAVPSGKPRVVFNAHRVYGYANIMEMFGGLNLEEFSLLPDKFEDGMIENADPKLVDQQWTGCGCYAFRKPAE